MFSLLIFSQFQVFLSPLLIRSRARNYGLVSTHDRLIVRYNNLIAIDIRWSVGAISEVCIRVD